ncbi:MAG: cytochrome d ubiquinol oxidase subunit II [Nocardioides sp.]|uniref:cytochrome d ubiquinol oxidase subunit II n=1 Tax=Nocardioides sp. TaxID=35761 RepID=UPI0039E5A75A
MELHTVWFILIAVLWTGYFVLEGFDMGVGILMPFLGRDDRERRAIINTIGPVWDGNEVWLLTAGGATFAAFPEWYATLFSGFYLPLLFILLALICRGVAFEYRHQRPSATWKGWWDRAIFVGSIVPAFLWGVAFANIVRGVPIDETKDFTGNLFTLLNPVGLLGGVVTLSLFVTHGAIYLTLKSTGDIRLRARRVALAVAGVAAVAAVVFLMWAQLHTGNAGSAVLFLAAALSLVGGWAAIRADREGWAFVGTFVCLALAVAGLFAALFPDVMPSSTSPDFSLTVDNASATPYTLKVMTWVALVFTPLVLAYQAWTYWVFRHRVSVDHIPDELAEVH